VFVCFMVAAGLAGFESVTIAYIDCARPEGGHIGGDKGRRRFSGRYGGWG
jgi:hypothetical protein